MGKKRQDKAGTKRSREDLSSQSSNNSQGTPEAKRAGEITMAAAYEDEIADEGTENEKVPKTYTQDPALAAIWEALVRIEANTNLLINDQKLLQTNQEELRKSLEFTQAQVQEMQKENKELRNKINTMAQNNRGLQQKVDLLQSKLTSIEEGKTKMEKAITDITLMHDDLEQYTRKFNLEIYGVPEEEEENVEESILSLARCIAVDLEPEDIDICHRLKKGNTLPKLIIVRFANYYSRDKMYRNRRNLRKANIGRFLKGAEKIYINENLTARRSGLFKKVRDMKRQHEESKTWTLDGKIFVKPDPLRNTAVVIKTEEDLEKL